MAVREHWFQILIACAALALAFGLGMSFQAEWEDAAHEEQIRYDLSNFSNKMNIFSNDVDRITRQAERAEANGEPVDDPMENWVIPSGLSFLRAKAADFADIWLLPQSRRYPNAMLYVNTWKNAFLGADSDNVEDLEEIVTMCRPIWDLNYNQSCKEIMAQLEENVTSGDYQDALPRRNITLEQKKQRIVVKVGTSTLTHNSGALDLWSMEHLVRTLADLQGMGHEVILVSSGAIAVGTAKLGLPERPKELRMKQAAAAVGQCRMMHIYDKFFSEYNRSMAQILLTGDDVEDPERAEHLSNTFSALLEMGVIPVVNENDSVSSAEIETGRHKVLGDNDTLSAIVAELCRADLLVLLSDIDGLYDADPKTHPEAKLLHQVTELTPEILEMAGGAGSWRGTGGMATKLSAARIAMEAGCDMVITNGSRMEDLYGIAEGKDIGTRFLAKEKEKRSDRS